MVKRNPRRPSSATPTSRPRRIAGSTGPTLPETAEVDETSPTEEVESPLEPEPEPEPDRDEATRSSPGLVDSPRTTRVLLGTIVALAVVTLAGGIFLWVDDDETGTASDSPSGTTSGPADADNPVRITGEDAQVAVAAAAQAAYTIVATSYQDYDAQVDEAVELMTPTFAEEYRQTAEDVEDAIVSSKTEVQVKVVAQGVVRADQEQVQALVFLNQYVTRSGKNAVYTPYRALVTMVHAEQGWLVSDLDTK